MEKFILVDNVYKYIGCVENKEKIRNKTFSIISALCLRNYLNAQSDRANLLSRKTMTIDK